MANGSARMRGSTLNPERNREPIVPIGDWLDRLCPLIMRGGDARCRCRLNSAA